MSSSTTPPKTKDEMRDTKMNLFEFIESVEKLNVNDIEMERMIAEQEAAQELAELAAQSSTNQGKDSKLSCGLRFLTKKSKDPLSGEQLSEEKNERKFSAEHKLKPSLRMKAFKNRQDTFHSLASCCEPPPETGSVNSSSASLTEDLMRMPYVEGLSSQVTQMKQKIYSKVHSEPLLPNNAAAAKEEPKNRKRRVLHTIVQPDGSVVGFCTEESEESSLDQERAECSSTEKPNSSGESFAKK
ncbi:hypothetical protein M3Y97_00059700 [Aphelenchoides bicaudatus]|nr:hypothetical protein M3Y97_00059700 [Aphelenchoides bicaudatus]